MPDHRWPLDPKPGECLSQNCGLRLGCPEPIARALAVAIAGPVEGQDPVPLSHEIEYTAGNPVLGTDGVAVHQHHRRTIGLASFHVMQLDAPGLDEAALRRMLPLSSM